jgi:hypothetical protein
MAISNLRAVVPSCRRGIPKEDRPRVAISA